LLAARVGLARSKTDLTRTYGALTAPAEPLGDLPEDKTTRWRALALVLTTADLLGAARAVDELPPARAVNAARIAKLYCARAAREICETTATRDGDGYVVTGHKIWTSYSDVADWCLLLARTDPDAPRHKGLSAFIVSMHQPGVEQRPRRARARRVPGQAADDLGRTGGGPRRRSRRTSSPRGSWSCRCTTCPTRSTSSRTIASSSDMDQVCRILESGANILTTRGEFHHRDSIDPSVLKKIEAACERGGSSVHSTGRSPGFITEALPRMLHRRPGRRLAPAHDRLARLGRGRRADGDRHPLPR
jgi:Acyl-CoA dehydrogenase, middle domain